MYSVVSSSLSFNTHLRIPDIPVGSSGPGRAPGLGFRGSGPRRAATRAGSWAAELALDIVVAVYRPDTHNRRHIGHGRRRRGSCSLLATLSLGPQKATRGARGSGVKKLRCDEGFERTSRASRDALRPASGGVQAVSRAI